MVKAFSSGFKAPDTRGELLYNVNLLEPHVALRLVEKVARLALHTQLDEDMFQGGVTPQSGCRHA
jgi:hypothetical protein